MLIYTNQTLGSLATIFISIAQAGGLFDGEWSPKSQEHLQQRHTYNAYATYQSL